MTKKMGLMALGLSMVLLSGCGSSSDDDGTTTPPAGTDLNTPSETAKSIIASWDTGCVEEDYGNGEVWYWVDKVEFYANGTGTHTQTDYAAAGCNPGDITGGGDEEAFSYELGDAVTSLDDKDAVEMDIFGEGWAYYTMTHFADADTFYLASETEGVDGGGETPETRDNDFTKSDAYIKQ